jgi:hypothetical protein
MTLDERISLARAGAEHALQVAQRAVEAYRRAKKHLERLVEKRERSGGKGKRPARQKARAKEAQSKGRGAGAARA